jgi:hypothetical protein
LSGCIRPDPAVVGHLCRMRADDVREQRALQQASAKPHIGLNQCVTALAWLTTEVVPRRSPRLGLAPRPCVRELQFEEAGELHGLKIRLRLR